MHAIGRLKRVAGLVAVALFVPGGSLLVLAALLMGWAWPGWLRANVNRAQETHERSDPPANHDANLPDPYLLPSAY